MDLGRAFSNWIEPREMTQAERELEDWGMSRMDLALLTHVDTATKQRAAQFANDLGVPDGALEANTGLAYDVAMTCAHCRVAGECEKGLEGRLGFDPQLCPNFDTFMALA